MKPLTEEQRVALVDRLTGEFEIPREVVEKMLDAARPDALVCRVVESREENGQYSMRVFVPVARGSAPKVRFNYVLHVNPWTVRGDAELRKAAAEAANEARVAGVRGMPGGVQVVDEGAVPNAPCAHRDRVREFMGDGVWLRCTQCGQALRRW